MTQPTRHAAFSQMQKDVISPLFEAAKDKLAKRRRSAKIRNGQESSTLELDSDPMSGTPYIEFKIQDGSLWCNWRIKGPDIGDVLICPPFEELKSVKRAKIEEQIKMFCDKVLLTSEGDVR